jgi:mannose-6-phosphate isomerase
MFLEGEGTIKVNEYSETFKEGDTVLIPALIENIKIISKSAIFLEIYIP